MNNIHQKYPLIPDIYEYKDHKYSPVDSSTIKKYKASSNKLEFVDGLDNYR
jgi:hypothetical protein